MTTNKTTIEVNGVAATFDHELMKGYLKEAFEHLDDVSEAQALFKEVVEAVADTTKLKKGKVAKYFKTKYKAKTSELKDEAELFGKLDEIVK